MSVEMPHDALSLAEEGLREGAPNLPSAYEMTPSPTEVGTLTSSKKDTSRVIKGSWFPTLRRWVEHVHIRPVPEKKTGLRIDGAMADLKVPKLEEYPKGFPRLACFLDSDEFFMVYKRFGIVFSRLLLNKQDEIRQMEAKFLAMDRTDNFISGDKYLVTRDRRDLAACPEGFDETRQQLLGSLERKVLEYSELLLKANQLKGLEKPALRDYRGVRRYMERDGGQLSEEESSWIYDKEDLITLRPGRESAWLNGILEHMLILCRGKIVRYIFCTPETNARTDNPAIHYYDRGRIAKCVTMFITLVILILLMVPIWLLYQSAIHRHITRTSETVVLILAFTLVFSAALSAFTRAKRHEIVAASAG